MKKVIRALCDHHKVSLRVAYKWLKTLRKDTPLQDVREMMDESYIHKSDPLEPYDADWMLKHYYDPIRPDYMRSL